MYGQQGEAGTPGTGTRLPRRREALENAWREAEGAEHADAAGRHDDRDVRTMSAIMWALIALGEKE